MRTRLCAHRGGGTLAPENTLAAFRKGLTYDPDSLEFDVHLTRDGVPVVIHDAMIERTTNGAGRVADFTLAELQEFDATAKFAGGATERQAIPTLAQVLDLVKDKQVDVDIEIKATAYGQRYTGIEQQVLDQVTARGMLDRATILAFEFDTIVRARAIKPRVRTWGLVSLGFLGGKNTYDPATAVSHLIGMGANAIGVNKDLLNPALVEEAHRRGLRLGVWTVDAEDEMRRLIALGVDSITTNRPDLLRRVLDE